MYRMSKREALLEATKDLLWRRGYAATSPSRILRQSRSGQGSLYHFFKGKQDLAAQALDDVEAEVSRRIEETLSPTTGRGAERLNRYLTGERDALRGCRLGRLAQDPELPEKLRKTLATGFDRLEAVLARAVTDAALEGALPASVDPTALADAAIAVVQGGYVLARAHRDPTRMTRAISAFSWLLRTLAEGDSKSEPDRPRRARTQAAPPRNSKRKASHA